MTDKGHKFNLYFEDDSESFNARYNDADPVTASAVWAMAYPVGELLYDVPTQTNYNALRMIEKKLEHGDANYILGGDLYEAYRWEYYEKIGFLGEMPEDEENKQPQPVEEVNQYTGNEDIDIVLRLWDSNKYTVTK